MSSQTSNHSANLGFFVTGTDTEIGKTYVSGCIAKTLLANKFTVAVRKPIASGCIVTDTQELIPEDALFLQQSSQTKDSLATICPYQFIPAISPQRAICQAGEPITINDLYQASKAELDCDYTLVEGAGGFLSPIALDGVNADLAVKHNLPVILVVGNRLGCINHALLTVEAIENRNLQLHCVIVNDITDDADPDNFTDLQELLKTPVYHLPFNQQKSPQIIAGFDVK